MISKSKLDRAGRALARDQYRSDDEYLEADEILDIYRQSHLLPLTETSSEIQEWLTEFADSYYLAQRLKRKPQILKKLSRLSVRLSQLQDIGGLRIIVPKNSDVNALVHFLRTQVARYGKFEVIRETDYRDKGRDRTGYRALHLLLQRGESQLELQVRSQVQHFWAETIERTSIIYGHPLKEEEGDPSVVDYFRLLSEAFYEIEAGRSPSANLRLKIDALHESAQEIISTEPGGRILNATPDEYTVRAMLGQASTSPGSIQNWIIVFDWNSGTFIHWANAPRDPAGATRAYADHERRFTANDGFEVVLVGSSEVSTLRKTHGHYFGMGSFDSILQNLDTTVQTFANTLNLGIDERKILMALHRRHKWGAGKVSRDTIRNHYCRDLVNFEQAINRLVAQDLIVEKNGVSLNQGRKSEIESHL